MPRFSIVVPSYGNAQYLPACLDSIANQPFEDWEAIVVIDASPDDAAGIAKKYAKRDARFVVIDKPENEGLHLARKTGVAAATGEYVTFLDGDDELAPDCLGALDAVLAEDPCDMLHFGAQVIDAGEGAAACEGYQESANRPQGPLGAQEAIHLTFEESGGYAQTWRAWATMYAASVAKPAFENMTATRLERAEDAYEYLVLSSKSAQQRTRTDIVGYRYFFGRGVSGSTALTAEGYCKQVGQFAACMDAIDNYAATFEDFDLAPAAAGARVKLSELMFNDWKTRVADDQKLAVATQVAGIVGKGTTAEELMRLSRDEAYRLYVEGYDQDAFNRMAGWAALARSLAADVPTSLRYARFAQDQAQHAADLAGVAQLQSFDGQPIRIFVASHKSAERFESSILQPIHVGAKQAAAPLWGMLRDDEGENISHLNPMYCELTAQYWAWKNVDAEYYGFCHYRRYFDFSPARHEENEWGEVMDDFIDADAQREYRLDDASIRAAVEGYDVITTEVKDLTAFPGEANTPLEHWHAAGQLYDQDLIDMFAIVVQEHPDYAPDVEAFANGTHSCFCNMFIMRRNVFDDYCSWLFPLLEKFMGTWDPTYYSKEALRTPGHLSERLLNIYLMHQARCGAGLKAKQVQCVHFTDPDPVAKLRVPSADECERKTIVPVVFASDDNYAPMLTCSIYSMLENASPDYYYDITVMTTNISGENQTIMRTFLEPLRSCKLRFVNVGRIIARYQLSTNNEHIGIETYYRFLIQDVLPYYDKVVYLDSDIIVQGDVSELFETDMSSNLIAAVRDADYLGQLNMKDGKRFAYTRDVLNMAQPYDYFQAGVLVLNTAALRREIPVATWLSAAQDTKYIYNDQDILNEYCQGRVTYLDYAWNVMHNGFNRIGDVISHAPAEVNQGYLASRGHEKVIHYAGAEKPWNTPTCDRGRVYWDYARRTPYYERLLMLLAGVVGGTRRTNDDEQWVISQDSPLRRIIDPLLPEDSQRREFVRIAARKLRGLPVD